MRVENWVLEVRKGRSLDDQKYIKDAFHTIEEKVRQALREVDQLVFESTGLTEHFDEPLLEHIFTFSRKITIWNNVTYKLPLYYE